MEKQFQFIFIIGLARSGTKLLRDLLNNHVQIFIDPLETQFIPMLHHQYSGVDLAERNNFHRFYSSFTESVYAINALKEKRKLLTEEQWYAACDSHAFSDVLKTFYKLVSIENKLTARVVGDKTPRYTGHIPLLINLFPEAKFIHIIRDPRDRALSEQHVWGKSLKKSVSDWTRVLERLQPSILKNPEKFLEVRYEDFVVECETTLKSITSFLNLPWQEGMTTLNVSPEQYGNAKGALKALDSSIGRYQKYMSKRTIYRLESISLTMIQNYRYSVNLATEYKPLGYIESKLLALYGRIKLCFFHIKDKGIVEGWQYFNKISG